MNCLFILFTVQLALGLVTHGQLGYPFHDGFAVLGGNIVSNLNTVGFLAHQQHFQVFDVVDHKLLEATGQHMLCFLVAATINVGHRDLALESSLYPVVDASEFLPVMLNFDIVWLVMDELLDLPFDDVGLHEGSESSHDAWLETDATASESIIIGSQHH